MSFPSILFFCLDFSWVVLVMGWTNSDTRGAGGASLIDIAMKLAATYTAVSFVMNW